MKSKKKYIPLKSSTPPRRPAFDVHIDDDDIAEDHNTTVETASDLSLSMSVSTSITSPDRSANTSSPTAPAVVAAPVQSAATVANLRRIERAAAALDAAGHKHLEGGRVGDALEAYRRALKLKRRLLNDDAATGIGSPIAQGEEAMLGAALISTINTNGSNRQDGDGDGGAARDPHREALLASVGTSVNNVCYARQRMGLASPDEALSAYQSSLDLKRSVRAESLLEGTASSRGNTPLNRTKTDLTDQEQHDLSVAKTLNNIGTVHLSTGAYPLALSSFRESCGLMLSILGPDHVDVSTVHGNAADALLGMKRYGEATEEYGRALKIRAARSGMDHRKSKRLLEKIQVAARAAAAAAKKKEEKDEQQKKKKTSSGPSSPSSPKSPALSVETLQRWFGETDVRDFCLLTDQCESDEEEDDVFGDLKSQLENDLDRITNIRNDLEEEQAAFMEEVRKMGDNSTDSATAKDIEKNTKKEGTATITRARASGEEVPRRIKSAADANDAVREVKFRLALVRARRNKQAPLDDGLDALRRIPVGAAFGDNIK